MPCLPSNGNKNTVLGFPLSEVVVEGAGEKTVRKTIPKPGRVSTPFNFEQLKGGPPPPLLQRRDPSRARSPAGCGGARPPPSCELRPRLRGGAGGRRGGSRRSTAGFCRLTGSRGSGKDGRTGAGSRRGRARESW